MPVATIELTLSEPILPGTFDDHALTLTLNGGTTNLITSAVSVALVPGMTTTYDITGLDAARRRAPASTR